MDDVIEDAHLHDCEHDLDPKTISSEPQIEASGSDELELFGDLQADMATADQLAEIKRLVAVTGASVEKIAAWGKVNFLRDLTQEQAEKAIEKLLCRAEKIEGLS